MKTFIEINNIYLEVKWRLVGGKNYGGMQIRWGLFHEILQE